MTRSSLRVPTAIRIDTLAALVVTSLPLMYFNAALRGTIVLASEDGLLFNVPLRVAAANMVRSGILSLWNPYIFSGMPLHASAQGGMLFPLNWFFLFFDAPVATNLMALSTYMLAALGAYLYARRSGSSVWGAILTSVIWQWCGFLIGQFSHVNIVQTAALLPWLLWAIDGIGKSGDRVWGLVVAAIVAFQAFTGHQQTLVYSLLLATAYALVMWRAHRPKRNFYAWSLVLLAAGMLLAAVQILPTYELMRNSLRSGSSFEFFTSFSLPTKFLLTFFAPYLFGGGDGRLFRVTYFGPPFYGEFIGYVGLGALILAVIALVLTKKDARTKFWAAVALAAFALALGQYWPFDLYRVIYYVPILNLFRVPARHMMEVDFALAVLAGRGLTAIAEQEDRKRLRRITLTLALVTFVLTCIVVTIGRPSSFRLAREAPVTLLRAPELFVPIFFAALSAWALWSYARTQHKARLCLIVLVIAGDLCVWGQTSGWRGSSPTPNDPYWHAPPPVKYLPTSNASLYRILTAPHPFDPTRQVVGPMTSRSMDWVLWLNPDIYMMHGIENAAGYDGFGLARYSQLAGDMTVWGELKNPDATLRGPGRELDLLNVKYVLAMSDKVATIGATKNSSSSRESALPATQVYGGQPFAENDMGLPNLNAGKRASFAPTEVQADRIALLSNLSWATNVTDGAIVGRIYVSTSDGRKFEFPILAGRDTAEWAHDRSDIKAVVRHRRATVGPTYTVEDAREPYNAHTYVSSFSFSERAVVTGVEIVAEKVSESPDLLLSILRLSLIDSTTDTAVPLQYQTVLSGPGELATQSVANDRWQWLADIEGVTIYENRRVLPRAWLTVDSRALDAQQLLEVIRSGKFADGTVWDPLRTALVESPAPVAGGGVADGLKANVIRNDPNRVEVKTVSTVPTILVLSANHYPGWRAYVDGQSVETLRVNYNLRGVVLPAGNHEVSFVYSPKSVLIGSLISLFAASGLTFWYFRLWGRVPRLLLHRRGERI